MATSHLSSSRGIFMPPDYVTLAANADVNGQRPAASLRAITGGGMTVPSAYGVT